MTTFRKKSGVTLFELIMVMMIVVLMSAAGALILVALVQNAIFIPHQLNMDMLVADALDIMIEGDDQAKGLRFSRSIVLGLGNFLWFRNQDNQDIVYWIIPGLDVLLRSIDGSIQALPYYLPSGIDLQVDNGRLFTYYNASEGSALLPSQIRRIGITLIAQTGSGGYDAIEGRSEQTTAIAVKRYQ